MNTKWIIFGLVGLVASTAFAQDTANSFYAKGTGIFTQGDLRSFVGGKSTGFAVELGHDLRKSDEAMWLSVFTAYQRVSGKENRNLVPIDTAGNQARLNTIFGLDTWRFGADLHFVTPVKGLSPFAGLNVNFHGGYWTNNSPILGEAASLPDNKAKFGFRVGVEYIVADNWGVSLEYNATEWRSDAKEFVDPVTQTTVRRGAGYNPVNPSWLGVSISYHF